MPQTKHIERPKFVFTVPEKVRQYPSDPKSITLSPITAGEEKDANDVADGAKTPLAYELVKRSTVEIDGKPIDWGKGDGDWLERCSPKVRQLVFAAFARVNQPGEDDTAAFLASEKVVQ